MAESPSTVPIDAESWCADDFRHGGLHQAIRGHELGAPGVEGRKQLLARCVDGQKRRQIHAIYGPAKVGHCPLPARRQFPDPWSSQLSFEL